MSRHVFSASVSMAFFGAAFLFPVAASAQWLDAAGWTRLFEEYGDELETGAGVRAMVPEAPTGAGNYMPNVNDSQFTGKTIINGTPGGSDDVSGHSNGSVRNLTGNTISIGRGITDITVFDANDFIGRVLSLETNNPPLPDAFDLGSHSYIANGVETAQAEEILLRFDHMIARDNAVHTVGLNNGGGSAIPQLLAPSHNAISVGRTDGSHSQGVTSLYTVGQTRPHIVTEGAATSTTTPRVGGAAAMLQEAARGTNAANNQVIRALLFAGATKEEFADWDRTATRPVDEQFGFGELNIFNSYKINRAGEFDGSSIPVQDAPLVGWDYSTFNGSQPLFYDLDLVRPVDQLNFALVWNADVDNESTTGGFTPVLGVADLNLTLSDSQSLPIQVSNSPVDNFEHIFATDLPDGRYSIELNGDRAVDFGLAWRVQYQPGVPAFVSRNLDGVSADGTTIAQTALSDELDFRVNPTPTTVPQRQVVDVLMIGVSPIENPGRFGFSVESRINGDGDPADVRQTIQLFNEETNRFETVDVRPAATNEAVTYFEAQGDLTRYIHPFTSEITARVRWESPSFEGSPFFWSVDIDEAVWVILEDDTKQFAPPTELQKNSGPARRTKGTNRRAPNAGF